MITPSESCIDPPHANARDEFDAQTSRNLTSSPVSGAGGLFVFLSGALGFLSAFFGRLTYFLGGFGYRFSDLLGALAHFAGSGSDGPTDILCAFLESVLLGKGRGGQADGQQQGGDSKGGGQFHGCGPL
jgi:hypothetical protein